ERSMFARPRDREVVCHASAWDLATTGDVRIKACLKPTEEDLFTIYHELGHVYYFISYAPQPYLFRDGANDGFHEAIGDTINLSVTPEYLAKIGLATAVTPSHEALINQQMKMALEKIAFLPFGRLIDQWRCGCSRARSRPRTTTAAGGSCAGATRASRHRCRAPRPTSIRARSTTYRTTPRTRAISCRSSCSSSSTRRCARPAATRDRCTSARTMAVGKRAGASPTC